MRIERLKKVEKFIPVKPQVSGWECPTDKDKLKEVIANESDVALYDWFSVLQGEPALFGTEPPEWLLKTIPHQRRKRLDLLDAIYEVLQCSDNPDIISALELYHGLKTATVKGVKNTSPKV